MEYEINGYTVNISRDDMNKLKQYSNATPRVFESNGNRYLQVYRTIDGRKEYVLAARLLMGIADSPDLQVTFKDGNNLNLKRSNMMIIETNTFTRVKRPQTSSKYKGVTALPNGKFKSQIKHEGIVYFLGYFDVEIDAAKAYNIEALKKKGATAKINILN